MDDKIQTWIKIGKANPWIKQVGSGNPEDLCAYEAPFGENYFYECKTLDELKEKFERNNWCLGQAFYYQNLCFINQIDGGDEWLTIKDNWAFESISWMLIIKAGDFENLMERLLTVRSKEEYYNLPAGFD